jgi:hypothetical protein
MVYGQAPVHDNLDSGCFQTSGHAVMADALLHPHENRLHLEHCVQQGRHVLRATEDIYDVDWSGGGG